MTAISGRTTRVDARGVLCPVPIIRLARAARSLPAGSVVELLSDDPAAEHDVPAWCRLRGHTLLTVTAHEETLADYPGRPAPLVVGEEPEVGVPPVRHPLRHLIRLEAVEPAL
jgi:tRNA 2-thiouridine synthesizing protein A